MNKSAEERFRFEKTVDGSRRKPGGFAHALCGATGRSGKSDAYFFGSENGTDRLQNGGFPGTGTSGDDGKFFSECSCDSVFLFGRKFKSGVFFSPNNSPIDFNRREPARRLRELADAGGDFFFGLRLIIFLE